MYEAVMLRKYRSFRRGFYIKKFNTLEELAKYIMLPFNYLRVHRIRGLTSKEMRILHSKCWSIERKDVKHEFLF